MIQLTKKETAKTKTSNTISFLFTVKLACPPFDLLRGLAAEITLMFSIRCGICFFRS